MSIHDAAWFSVGLAVAAVLMCISWWVSEFISWRRRE